MFIEELSKNNRQKRRQLAHEEVNPVKSLEEKLVIPSPEIKPVDLEEDDELPSYQVTYMEDLMDQIRKQRECIAPQITACVPILPANDPSLLGLPEGIGIEIIDLPGLKSIQDKDNLKIIQEQVAKAFSLVALDYSQVDERHRKRLLEELKQMVEYLQGRTDSMIFILNRVDRRCADDLPLEQRIEQLKLEIKEVLALEELPDIIPLSGQMLYYAQNAWGAVSIKENSPVDSDTRLSFLTAMLKDCS